MSSNRSALDRGVAGIPLQLHHLRQALAAAGWTLRAPKEGLTDLCAVKGGRRVAIEFKQLREPRRPLLQALLADAIMRGRAARGEGEFLAIVGAPVISDGMAESLERYVAEVAPGQPFGYVDERGRVRLHGQGFEAARREPVRRPGKESQGAPRDVFSDLNQWLLKVLLSRRLPAEFLSGPRDAPRSGPGLARRAGVSAPAAWRFLSALKLGGHLDEAGEVVRVRDLLARWRAAALRPHRQVGAVFTLPGRAPFERLRKALADMERSLPEPSACLGLFAACDALGLGHVSGAPTHLYVRQVVPAVLERLGLALAPRGQPADLLLRVPRWPESVFRAAVRPEGAPVADVLQCWLDVSAEPARGAEQAAFLWNRVIGPQLAGGEPPP